MFVPIKDIKWIDQSAHFVVALLLTFDLLFAFNLSMIVALLIVMFLAFSREQIQHYGGCGRGCRTDLLFFFLGAGSMMVWMG